MKTYIVVRNTSVAQLEKIVNTRLTEGYTLVGGLSVVRERVNTWLMQAMMLEELNVS